MNINEAIEKYFASQTYGESTARVIKSILNNFAKTEGISTIHEITLEKFNHFVETRTASHKSSIRGFISYLHGLNLISLDIPAGKRGRKSNAEKEANKEPAANGDYHLNVVSLIENKEAPCGLFVPIDGTPKPVIKEDKENTLKGWSDIILKKQDDEEDIYKKDENEEKQLSDNQNDYESEDEEKYVYHYESDPPEPEETKEEEKICLKDTEQKMKDLLNRVINIEKEVKKLRLQEPTQMIKIGNYLSDILNIKEELSELGYILKSKWEA